MKSSSKPGGKELVIADFLFSLWRISFVGGHFVKLSGKLWGAGPFVGLWRECFIAGCPVGLQRATRRARSPLPKVFLGLPLPVSLAESLKHI